MGVATVLVVEGGSSTVLYALRRSGVDSRDNITVTYIEPIHLKDLKGLQIKKRDTGKIIMFL